MITFILWIILAFISLPVAIGVLVLYPIIWLILLPFKLLGFAVGVVFDLLRSIILFPLKILKIV